MSKKIIHPPVKDTENNLLCHEVLCCPDEQQRLRLILELAFSIGYDAGYENGKKSTLPQNTEVPQVKD